MRTRADTTPPTLTAKVNEGVLHIEASDAESGVEAVFIGGQRVNYRVDGTLDVVLRDYAGTGELFFRKTTLPLPTLRSVFAYRKTDWRKGT